jgi:3-methyl-2-oxobutanoate hydroxymethyltransferase
MSVHAPAPAAKVTTTALRKMREAQDRITMLSCYDASFAALLDGCGVDMLLVGDSLGMVVQGHDSTLPVTMDEAVYHTRCVARGAKRAMVVGDLPFASYQVSPKQAYENAARLMAAGAHMVKLEGGAVMAPTVEFVASRGIPMCGHIGLTPQSVHQLGGFRVQGKTDDAARRLIDEAKLLEQAGAAAMVVECVPAQVGKDLTEALRIPTIGIGAGPHCSAQILILHDMLDVYPGRKARFVKNFMEGAGSIQQAVRNFVAEVKAGTFPGPEHCF